MYQNIQKVIYTLIDFIKILSEFTYKTIFYEVTIGELTFPLWQLFAVIGVGVFIIAVILKILI